MTQRSEAWTITRTLSWIRWRDPELATHIGNQGPSSYMAAVFYPAFPVSAGGLPRVYTVATPQEQRSLLEALRSGRVAACRVDPQSGAITELDPRTWLAWNISPSGQVTSEKDGLLSEIFLEGDQVRKEWPSLGRDLEAELLDWLNGFLGCHRPTPELTKDTIRKLSRPHVGTIAWLRCWSDVVRRHPEWTKPGPRKRDKTGIQNT